MKVSSYSFIVPSWDFASLAWCGIFYSRPAQFIIIRETLCSIFRCLGAQEAQVLKATPKLLTRACFRSEMFLWDIRHHYHHDHCDRFQSILPHLFQDKSPLSNLQLTVTHVIWFHFIPSNGTLNLISCQMLRVSSSSMMTEKRKLRTCPTGFSHASKYKHARKVP